MYLKFKVCDFVFIVDNESFIFIATDYLFIFFHYNYNKINSLKYRILNQNIEYIYL